MSYEASFQSYPQNESILSPPHYISRQFLLFCLQLAGTAEKLASMSMSRTCVPEPVLGQVYTMTL